MDRYIKYKDIVKLYLCNDFLKNSSPSQYNLFSSTISSVTVNAGGANYNASNLGFKIDGGGGSGLLLSATVASGAISAITVIDGGVNYSTSPIITTTSGVNSISVNNGGSGYGTIEGQVIISIVDPGDGIGFRVGSVTVTAGAITAVAVASNGQGYTRPPTLAITGTAGGSGAVLTANIGNGANLSVPSFTNSKRLRYSLNSNLNNITLSKYARLVLETSHIPLLTNMSAQVFLLRVSTSTEDKQYDTIKGMTGNPILMNYVITASQTIINTSQDFFSINIPSNFLMKQFLEFEIEFPYATANINFISAAFQSSFFIALKIIDVDPELSEDRPQIDMANYNSGKVPLRIYS